MSINKITILTALAACAGMLGCSKAAPDNPPPISYKTRVENMHARIDKTYRLSETESIKIVIVPGHPYGERCVIYTNGATSAMRCRELLAQHQ